jgi:hypothetical protein
MRRISNASSSRSAEIEGVAGALSRPCLVGGIRRKIASALKIIRPIATKMFQISYLRNAIMHRGAGGFCGLQGPNEG